jgi:hypothetical protein
MPIASYREMRQPIISGRTVILMEVPRNRSEPMISGVIEDKVFEHCSIIGPAVVAASGKNDITLSEFYTGGNPDNLLLETKGKLMVGMIAFNNCKFRMCEFKSISFAGPPDALEVMRHSIH